MANDESKVKKIDEEAMKSPKGKEKWRLFINKYEGKGESRCRSVDSTRGKANAD